MERSDHILIVDDDAEIRTLLQRYLERNGLRATAVSDGRGLWQALDRGAFDLVVLDVMLPGDDGLTLCRELRAGKHKATPVLMLTARTDDTDRIVGLEMGADDYLAKPFVARELLARIKAVLRRTRMMPPNLQVTEAGQLLAFGDWQLDTVARHLLDSDGTAVALSGAEYRLLRVFLDHPLFAAGAEHVPTLMVEIKDDGAGIPAAQLERLATPFFTTRPGGTGLGLAVARHWVARHGGRLRIESAPGEGTSVRVTLPLRRAA